MRAFIVRPFGKRDGIDFDAVQDLLIQPALTHQNIEGGTTGLILEAGNIREDMFQQLLVADLVIADISIHNANVFYELGVRHALQPRHTFLIRSKNRKAREERGPQDEVPFDLRTDRYLEYDPDSPAAAVNELIAGLAATRVSRRQDSPVFLLLPNLEAQDRRRFLTVPLEFGEAVEHAAKAGNTGRLGLLGLEARGQTWSSEGLRTVAREQFNCKAYVSAKLTWESLRELDAFDVEANLMLGTVYQKLGQLDLSNQALERVASNESAKRSKRAEALALLARNTKVRWRNRWEGKAAVEERRQAALRSPDMLAAFEKYCAAYQLDLNHYYSGLNALSLLTIGLALAGDMPETFKTFYDSDQEAEIALATYQTRRTKLAAAVTLSLEAAAQNNGSGTQDRWLTGSVADLNFLMATRPGRVQYLYESALSNANEFEIESMRAQLDVFESLGLLAENTKAALAAFPRSPNVNTETSLDRVLLFTGHMIDAPDRQTPRFPRACVPLARRAIREAVEKALATSKPNTMIALAGGACGGDLLFHEACEELGIRSEMYLALPPNVYRTDSVDRAGEEWTRRFDALLQRSETIPVLASSEALPPWLVSRPGWSPWQRANLWLLTEALAKGAPNVQLIALWDGEAGDGPGGTEHLFRIARENGAGTVHLDSRQIFASSDPSRDI